ncbi:MULTISPECIES: sugar phosphate isomerase/epimerase family protein [unclassified Amycolatopsis]|uniref:sugar phosphate isomerase/epimerase family protein n=1 Tax=unclassified Amycolatopsis TaxID=2618356 RepID=UPI002E12C570|nr:MULTISPECIES: TIM barrel protein [unclassified Amycolatopsis]WSJ81319.1 TIM barrel protein [Amycolatopsis sp. NBC_01307]WSK75307.1 TIM barrel protein [Amycolatopsis sp. NBC_01286]
MSLLSVQLYSVRDAFAADPADTLRRLAAIGFTQVEPYGVVENVEALRAGLPANGLTAPTAHARLIGADQAAVFAAAAELGIGLVIDPLVKPEQWQDPADIAATADALNAAAKVAAEHGVGVGYHNHWWELESRIDGRAAFEVFADQLDPAVALEVDTYWATAGGENAAALLGRLGDRVKAIHVKDGGLATDASGQLPAGQGQVPIAEVLAAAPTALRVVEFDAFDGDLFEAIAASHAFLTGAGQ